MSGILLAPATSKAYRTPTTPSSAGRGVAAPFMGWMGTGRKEKGMELFIKVYFWIALVGVFLKMICVGWVPYPRNVDRGTDVISVIFGIPFIVWAGWLLWG